MRTGLTKREKTTAIYFDEFGSMIEVQTHNTNLKKRLTAFAEKYPKGYNDYFPDLVKYDKPDGTSFYAVMVEIPDAIYLVKIKVKTDDAEDIERWLDGEDGDDSDGNEGESLPDDNISQYSTDDDGADA